MTKLKKYIKIDDTGKNFQDLIPDVIFNGIWNVGENKTFDVSLYKKMEFTMVDTVPGSIYQTKHIIVFDNECENGLISDVWKVMNGYIMQCEIQKRTDKLFKFDYVAYAHQTNMNSWTTGGCYISKVVGYKN